MDLALNNLQRLICHKHKSDMKHNSTALDAFAEVVKVTHYYVISSSPDTLQVLLIRFFLNGLEHSLGIHSFRLKINVLAT